MANEIIINGNKYEPYFAGEKLKEAWLNGERIWASGYDDIAIALVNVSTNLYNVFISEDKWATATKIIDSVAIGDQSDNLRIRRYDGRVFIQSSLGSSSRTQRIYELNIDLKSITLLNSISVHYAECELLEEFDNIIPLFDRNSDGSVYYIRSYDMKTNTFGAQLRIPSYATVTNGKYAFHTYNSNVRGFGVFDKVNNCWNSYTQYSSSVSNVYSSSKPFYLGNYFYTLNSGIFMKSADNGNTFTMSYNSSTATLSIQSIATNGNGIWVFTAYRSGKLSLVFTSKDNGNTIELVSGLEVTQIGNGVRFDGKQFVINDCGNYCMYLSDDGITWVKKQCYALLNSRQAKDIC